MCRALLYLCVLYLCACVWFLCVCGGWGVLLSYGDYGTTGVKMYNGTMDCASKLVKAEGPGALFKGLPPALLRQSTYGSLRYGLYGPIKNSMGECKGLVHLHSTWKAQLSVQHWKYMRSMPCCKKILKPCCTLFCWQASHRVSLCLSGRRLSRAALRVPLRLLLPILLT